MSSWAFHRSKSMYLNVAVFEPSGCALWHALGENCCPWCPLEMIGDSDGGNSLLNNTIMCRWILKHEEKADKEKVKYEENWAGGATLKLTLEKGGPSWHILNFFTSTSMPAPVNTLYMHFFFFFLPTQPLITAPAATSSSSMSMSGPF